MKRLLFILAFVCSIGSLSAQILYHRTRNPNVGFGKVSNSITNPKMDFCVNGPLVGNDNIPIGGYIDNGTVIKNWTNPTDGGGNFAIDNGIFGLGMDGKLYMKPYTEKETLPQMRWAFQNGPLLVKDSVNTRGTSTSVYTRSGIGYTNDGTLVVIVSLTPLTFRQFADLFIQEGCIHAIYLDGGPYVGCSDKQGSYGTMVAMATKLQFFNN